MQVVYERCAGLDLHKKRVVACRVRMGAHGDKQQEVTSFGTMTPDLLRLVDWLLAWDCTHVALESTGEYWKPIYNLLEGQLEVLLVNAQHVKHVPGRKTDKLDAEWLADLLRHGLLRASFIPPRPQRALRPWRATARRSCRSARVTARLQKGLEDANIKLSAVVTDTLGVSGRAMLEALVAGESDPTHLADLARGRLRRKIAELEQALTGVVQAHHRSGRVRPGNKHLRATLVPAAWAASRSRATNPAAPYRHLVTRRGKKRALVALAHALLVIVYHMLLRHQPYRELGGNFFDDRKREEVVNRLTRRLEKMGYHVQVDPLPSVA